MYETNQIYQINWPRHASFTFRFGPPSSLLHAHELARGDQILSGAELLLTQQMLQRRNPGRHLRQHNINLLSQVLQPAAQPRILSLRSGFFFARPTARPCTRFRGTILLIDIAPSKLRVLFSPTVQGRSPTTPRPHLTSMIHEDNRTAPGSMLIRSTGPAQPARPALTPPFALIRHHPVLDLVCLVYLVRLVNPTNHKTGPVPPVIRNTPPLLTFHLSRLTFQCPLKGKVISPGENGILYRQ